MATMMPKPLCRACQARQGNIVHIEYASTNARVGNSLYTTDQLATRLNMPVGGLKSWFRIGLVVSNVILTALGLSALLQTGSSLLLIPLGVSLLGHIPLNMLFKASAKTHTGRSQSGTITMAQFETLMRISDDRISAKRLASTTGTDLKAAENFLNQLVLESKLHVDNDAEGLIYTRNSLLR